MTTLNVPSSYLTIADAVAAASESDTIKVAAGYGGNESVTVTTDNLTFDIAAGVPNVVLTAGSGVSKIFANGFGPVLSVRSAMPATIPWKAAAAACCKVLQVTTLCTVP